MGILEAFPRRSNNGKIVVETDPGIENTILTVLQHIGLEVHIRDDAAFIEREITPGHGPDLADPEPAHTAMHKGSILCQILKIKLM